MELSQVRGVQGFVPEYAVNRKILHGFELTGLLLLLRQVVQHLRAHGGSVSSQDVFLGLGQRPALSIAERTIKSVFMRLLHSLHVVFGHFVTRDGVFQEEGVVHVSGWMRLRLEQRVEVPEARLHELVGWHLVEAHLE